MRIVRPVLGLLMVLPAALPGLAQEPALSLVPALQLVAEPERMPLARVLRAIDAQIPGRALDAKVREGGDRPTYRVKWLGDDGKVRVVTADARSGKILKVR